MHREIQKNYSDVLIASRYYDNCESEELHGGKRRSGAFAAENVGDFFLFFQASMHTYTARQCDSAFGNCIFLARRMPIRTTPVRSVREWYASRYAYIRYSLSRSLICFSRASIIILRQIKFHPPTLSLTRTWAADNRRLIKHTRNKTSGAAACTFLMMNAMRAIPSRCACCSRVCFLLLLLLCRDSISRKPN